MSTDHRQAAADRIAALMSIAGGLPPHDTRDELMAECASLAQAIRTFHLEAIRFRMFNVDRLLSRGALALPPEAHAAFAGARDALEAAGFHTRSHQAPG
jgi:hypothetical protein